MVGKTGRSTFMVLVMLTMFGIPTSSLPTTASTTLEPLETGLSIQKSVSFEDREAKSLLDQPIIMQMLPNDSYFPKNENRENSEQPPVPTPEPTVGPTENPNFNKDVPDYRTQASSYSYSASSAWTPIPANTVPLSYAQPVYFPAPAVYGYPVNNYRPPLINFEGGPQSSSVSYGAPPSLKEAEPVYTVPEIINPLPSAGKSQEVLYNVPVKSVEYIAPVKTEYGIPDQKPLPRYNAIQKPYEAQKDEPIYAVPLKYDASGPASQGYGAPAVYENQEVSPEYGALGSHSGIYGRPTEISSYGAPNALTSAYGAPHAPSGKNVHNIHQKILHRYNHHQKVLHEHNLHRYIVHNYHLHRFHVHNHHNHKEDIHLHKEHIHNKFEQKVTEEHKTKETEAETHKKGVTEVKESHRNSPPIYNMHVVKSPWTPWG